MRFIHFMAGYVFVSMIIRPTDVAETSMGLEGPDPAYLEAARGSEGLKFYFFPHQEAALRRKHWSGRVAYIIVFVLFGSRSSRICLIPESPHSHALAILEDGFWAHGADHPPGTRGHAARQPYPGSRLLRVVSRLAEKNG
jgi:hypothetical protein